MERIIKMQNAILEIATVSDGTKKLASKILALLEQEQATIYDAKMALILAENVMGFSSTVKQAKF